MFVERGADVIGSLDLPCGRCIGCRQERARQWTIRVMHEASLHEECCFITLTYDDGHLPPGGSLVYRDFQYFMRRLRRSVAEEDKRRRKTPRGVRFFACGEYGEELGRPHFHAALFGVSFREDRYVWRKGESKAILYRSPALERLWPFGISSVGELTEQSAGYIARYVLKKVTGHRSDEHYRKVDKATGEVVWLEPEFVRMSLKPGIGARWIDRFGPTDVFPHDRVVFRGRETPVPRYYRERLKVVDPDLAEQHSQDRILRALGRRGDSTPERLLVREAVQKARLSFFKRKLK